MSDVEDSFPDRETFWTIPLNTKKRPLGRHLVGIGTATACLAHPREVFRIAILTGAVSVVVVHTHPSGDPEPSSADIAITRQLKDAGKIIGIEVVDHVIVGTPEADPSGRGWHSMRMSGLL